MTTRLYLISLALLSMITACTKTKLSSPKDETPTNQARSEASVPAPPSASLQTSDKVVNLFVWGNYTSPELLSEFSRKTGIKVIESNYGSNEELLAKLQAGATGYDLAVPSDYMVTVMSKLDLLEPLDKTKIPNIKNLDPTFVGKTFDPENKFSLPYAWTVTGIAVNTTAYPDPVTSWADLFNNPKVSGRLSLLDDVRETMGAALKLNGFSINATKPEELQKAKETLLSTKKHVKTFNSSPIDAITSGEVWIAQMYGQEAMLAARHSGGKLAFVLPKEGGLMAVDNLVLLKSAKHKEEAYQLINFLLEVPNNVDFVKRVAGGPVLKETKNLLPPELQSSPTLFPPAEVLSKFETLQDLGDATALYDRIWSEIKVSSH